MLIAAADSAGYYWVIDGSI